MIDLPETTAEYIRGLCVENQKLRTDILISTEVAAAEAGEHEALRHEVDRLKAQLAERDARLTAFIGDLDAAGMTNVALGINDILEGK